VSEHLEREVANLTVLVQGLHKSFRHEPRPEPIPDPTPAPELQNVFDRLAWIERQIDRLFGLVESIGTDEGQATCQHQCPTCATMKAARTS
jgi:hypothetical protein